MKIGLSWLVPYLENEGKKSSTRLLRFEVVQVVLICLLSIVWSSCYLYIKSDGVTPDWENLISNFGYTMSLILAGLGLWCGISNKTEKFDSETEIEKELKKE